MAERLTFPLSTPVPDRLDLTVGDEVAIELKGLGTAGYRWREQVNGEPDVVTVAWHTARVNASDLRRAGSSPPGTATIRAEKAGAVTVLLQLARPWESTVEPVKRIEISVTVAPGT